MMSTLLVCGTGNIARHHLANLSAMRPDLRVVVLRGSPQQLRAPLGDNVVIVRSIEDAIAAKPVVAVVAGASTSHVAMALPLVRAGVPLLIEKPLSNSLHGVAELEEAVEATGVPVLVGYLLRFHPLLVGLRERMLEGTIGRVLALRAEVGQFLPDWRPGFDHRLSVSAQAALGGGALLELSHEIDYARWLVGDPVSVRADLRRLGDVTVDVEDWVDLHWRTAAGVMVDLHMDMLQRLPVRNCNVIGTHGTLSADLITGDLRLRKPGRQTESLAMPSNATTLLQAEARTLLAMLDGSPSPIPIAEGRRVLTIVDAARRSAAEGGREVPACA